MRPHIWFLALAASTLLGACASDRVALRPAVTANVAANTEGRAAIAAISGIKVMVAARRWPGIEPIENVVTPLRVRIENVGSKPVAIRYNDVALVAPAGQTFAALPPYSIDATVAVPRLMPGYPTSPIHGFVGSRFAVSPLYAPAFPGFPVTNYPFHYDPLYYDDFGRHWQRVVLPTPEMLRLALPEGTLDPGGSIDGFLYFQKVGLEVPSVRFRMNIISAQNGQAIGMIEIPFVVTKP